MSMYYVVTSYELYHHGIKGQKWGVRRYQNEDGTLTEEGKKRYAYAEKHGQSTDPNRWVHDDKEAAKISATAGLLGYNAIGTGMWLMSGGSAAIAGLFAANPVVGAGALLGAGALTAAQVAIGRKIAENSIEKNGMKYAKKQDMKERKALLKDAKYYEKNNEGQSPEELRAKAQALKDKWK